MFLLDRLPEPGPRALRGLAWASLVSQIGIIVTGGAVRLTGSGLGCPTFPSCTEDSLVNTPEHGVHGYIEFGNRLLTFVLGAIALAMLLAVLRARRRDLLVPSAVLLLGIPAQAAIGGMTVLTNLNPWVVMLHFMCSAVLVGVAMVLVRRAERTGDGRDEDAGLPQSARRWLGRLAAAVVAVTYATVYAGTIVTGSGPHAGDPDSPRTGLDVSTFAQLHADFVFLLIGLCVGLWWAAYATNAPRRTTRAAAVLVALLLAQGAVGFVQYALDVPVLLVGLHMLGAAVLVAAAVDAWLAVPRARSAAPGVPGPDEPVRAVAAIGEPGGEAAVSRPSAARPAAPSAAR